MAWLRIVLVLALIAAGYAKGHHDAAQSGAITIAKQAAVSAGESAKRAQLALKASEDARATERRHALELNQIASSYEQDKQKNEADAARTLADLRSGAIRLSSRWRCAAGYTDLPEAGPSSSRTDAGALDREASASRAIRAAADADAQIRGLQTAIRTVCQ